MYKNITLFIICVFINLLIGNIVLFVTLTNIPIFYHLLISISVIIIYTFTYKKLNCQNQKPPKTQMILISIITSLICMLAASVFTSIGLRMPFDNIITAGLKGVLPMFVFALFFASPVWIPVAICNYFCFNNMKYNLKDK